MAVSFDARSNIEEVKRNLTSIQKKQIPFATSVALNKTAFDVRENEQKGMDRQLDRPTPFTKRGVQVQKSTKRKLEASVFIEEKRAKYLKYQVYGGTRTPRRRVVMVPGDALARNRYGNVPGWRRKRAQLLAKPGHFEANMRGVSGIWRRKGKGRNNVELVVYYAPSAKYEQVYKFQEIAMKTAQGRFAIQFGRALASAIRTTR